LVWATSFSWVLFLMAGFAAISSRPHVFTSLHRSKRISLCFPGREEASFPCYPSKLLLCLARFGACPWARSLWTGGGNMWIDLMRLGTTPEREKTSIPS
jgi:hypothetical protein